MITVTQMTIHQKDVSPVYGESIIHVRLEDDGGGKYVIISQENNEIAIDFDEVPELMEAIERLKRAA